MTQNEEQFLQALRQVAPDVYAIMDIIDRGMLTAEEVALVASKMAIIRTSDEGYGKILVEMQRRKENPRWFRIRTMQDLVIDKFPDERVFDI